LGVLEKLQAYIIRRLLLGILTVYGVATLSFVLMRIVPGDPAMIALAEPGRQEGISQALLEKTRHELGLDKPLHVQYGLWLFNSLKGDFGRSSWGGDLVTKEYAKRLPISMSVAVLASVLAALIGIPLGVISAIRQDTLPDYVARIVAIAGLSMPSFWVAVIMIVILLRVFHWLPSLEYTSIWSNPGRSLSQLIFPAFAVGFGSIGILARMTRSSLLEVLREDYIRTAHAKGLGERVIIIRHALRNALLPVMTILGLQLGFALGGLVVVEVAFNLPGAGRFLYEATVRRDYNVVQASLLGVAVFVTLANLLVDIAYAWVDPRIRYK